MVGLGCNNFGRKLEKDVRLSIVVGEGMKPGTYMTGMIKVHLNHPASPLKEVMFNGFIR